MTDRFSPQRDISGDYSSKMPGAHTETGAELYFGKSPHKSLKATQTYYQLPYTLRSIPISALISDMGKYIS
jgi:hypothetical protein